VENYIKCYVVNTERYSCVFFCSDTAHLQHLSENILFIVLNTDVEYLSCVAGFFDEAGSTVEKVFQKVANALSSEYRFAHSYKENVYETYGYRKCVFSCNKHTHFENY